MTSHARKNRQRPIPIVGAGASIVRLIRYEDLPLHGEDRADVSMAGEPINDSPSTEQPPEYSSESSSAQPPNIPSTLASFRELFSHIPFESTFVTQVFHNSDRMNLALASLCLARCDQRFQQTHALSEHYMPNADRIEIAAEMVDTLFTQLFIATEGLLQVASIGESMGFVVPDQQMNEACSWNPEVVIEGLGITNYGILTHLGHDECVPLGTDQYDEGEDASMEDKAESGASNSTSRGDGPAGEEAEVSINRSQKRHTNNVDPETRSGGDDV